MKRAAVLTHRRARATTRRAGRSPRVASSRVPTTLETDARRSTRARGVETVAAAMPRSESDDDDGDAAYDDGDASSDDDDVVLDLIDADVAHGDATAALRRARDAHGLDARDVARGRPSEEAHYDVVKWVNYVRAEAAKRRGTMTREQMVEEIRAGARARAWDDDAYLRPTLEDDGALFGWEAYVEGREEEDADEDDEEDDEGAPSGEEMARRLRLENEALRVRLCEVMTTAGMVDEASVAEAFSPVVAEGTETHGRGTSAAVKKSAAESMVSVPTTNRRRAPTTAEERLKQEVDDGYFDSYSYFDIHRDMIGDTARTDAYRDALEKNPTLIQGKNVLDIGCGTGILSMFAARGGASAVVGVDGAKHIAEVAKANVKHNGFSDRIQIVYGKLEDIEGDIPGAPFDVLVSEWMGYGLLFESMLDTVLVARDRFLKPGGAVLPDIATIHIAGFDRKATDFPFWEDVYGFEMPEIKKQLFDGAMKTAVVTHVEGSRLTTSGAQVCELDLATCSIADTEFTTEFSLSAKDGRVGEETHGIVLWFDTEFSKRFCADLAVMLSTSPDAKKTHWVQTMLHFREPITLGDQATDSIVGRISMVKSKSRPRAYDVSLEYRVKNASGEGPTRIALYAL